MLTKQQYKFLKKLLKKDIPCDELHENRDEVFLYLQKNNLISTYLAEKNLRVRFGKRLFEHMSRQ